MTEHSPVPFYSAWSERECRWITMDYAEYQSWLSRPDLDPVEFASDETSESR